MGKSARVEFPPLAWQSEDGLYTVVVSKAAFCEILGIAVKHAPNEVGTCLIGHYSGDGFDAHVTGLAPLSADSRGTRTAFLRGIQGLKEFFNSLTRPGSARLHYVGEWHSHPMAAPAASPQDDRDHTAIAFEQKTNCPEVIMLIVGGDLADRPGIGAYVYSRKRGKIKLVPKGD